MNAKTKAAEATTETTAQKPFVPKVVNHVTLPLLKMEDKVNYYLQILKPIKQDADEVVKYNEKKKAQDEAGGKSKETIMEPPHLTQVMNLETGELHTFIVPTVLLLNLEKEYPNETYVKKGFQLKKQSPEGKRKYSLFDIAEIEV